MSWNMCGVIWIWSSEESCQDKEPIKGIFKQVCIFKQVLQKNTCEEKHEKRVRNGNNEESTLKLPPVGQEEGQEKVTENNSGGEKTPL